MTIKQWLQILEEIRMHYQYNFNDLLSDYSLDVFTVTCGRTGVGSITSVELRIAGTIGWYVNWIDVSDGTETHRFEVDDWLEGYDTQHSLHLGQINQQYN